MHTVIENITDVILVDDVQFARRMIANTLANLTGAEVHEASGGNEAIRHITEMGDRVGLLVCDINLRKPPTGVDVITHFRSVNPKGQVVVITGMAHDEALRNELKALNVEEVLSKPIDPIRLAETLKRVGERCDA